MMIDAGHDHPALERLVELAERRDLPLALAVVPLWLGAPVQALIAASARTTVLQHGFAHANHAPPGAKSVELGRFGLACCDELGLRTSAPRDDGRRGGHICVHEPGARELTKRLFAERKVLADYRDPGVIRLGCSPLTTRFADVANATIAIAELKND